MYNKKEDVLIFNIRDNPDSDNLTDFGKIVNGLYGFHDFSWFSWFSW